MTAPSSVSARSSRSSRSSRSARSSRSGRPVRSRRAGQRRTPLPALAALLAVTLLVAAVFAVALVSWLGGGSGGTTASATQLAAFDSAIHPAIIEGGQVEELGLKVALEDLGSEHKTAPSLVARQASGWQDQLAGVHRTIAAAPASGPLRTVRSQLVAVVDRYAHVALLLHDAAVTGDAKEQNRLLDQAAAEGRSADQDFDRAAAHLQSLRRSAGLPPSPDFPDSTTR